MSENKKVRKIESHLTRSQIMSRIRSKDTKPEMIVRRLVYSLGYRYRLHRKELPGTPDLVFFNRKKIIFIHGCFWHDHNCKLGLNKPKSNQAFWISKLSRNVQRDQENREELVKMGWKILVIWECELKSRELLVERITAFLNSSP